MLFNSVVFGIFFIAVFYIYWLFLRSHIQLRNIFIILASYLFYGWWDYRFLFLIIISSLADFFIGNSMFQEEDANKRKRLLIASLVVNLGFLGFFKYFNFFIGSFIDAFSLFGIQLNASTLNIILPVGISFYTFQSLSYTIDIYKKEIEPTKDVFAFLAFVAFFPQLVAGPIERAKKLLPQFHSVRPFNYSEFRSGIFLMAWGFVKKIVIADRLAKYVDAAFQDVDNTTGFPALIAAIFFAFQLYLDFSAYSDIAIGTARTLGFKLSDNFRRPYLAKSFSDFWRRWHISLSTWFRDYVYIPLGGNRNGKTIRNLMIVFLVSGLWHGASWNFVIWGGFNGLFVLVFDRFIIPKSTNIFSRVYTGLVVFGMWTLSLVFFRAQSFGDAIVFYNNLLETGSSTIFDYGLMKPEMYFTIALLCLLVAIEIFIERSNDIYMWINHQKTLFRWSLYIILSVIIILFGKYGESLPLSNFVYFQF